MLVYRLKKCSFLTVIVIDLLIFLCRKDSLTCRQCRMYRTRLELQLIRLWKVLCFYFLRFKEMASVSRNRTHSHPHHRHHRPPTEPRITGSFIVTFSYFCPVFVDLTNSSVPSLTYHKAYDIDNCSWCHLLATFSSYFDKFSFLIIGPIIFL